MERRLYALPFALIFGVNLFLGSIQTVYAQKADIDEFTLEEITVTVQKRQETLQKTSVSVGVVQGEKMDEWGVHQVDHALLNIPGVIVSIDPVGGYDINVRGVGAGLPTAIGGSAGVSQNYDGIYNNESLNARTGFYDLARIEVLRGPQGTLYGRNAEGGVLNVVTNDPTQNMEASFSAGIGNYKLQQFSGMGNFPITDTFAVRIAGASVDREGFYSNGQDDNIAKGVRAKALWTPGDSFSLLLGSELTKIDGKGRGDATPFTDIYPDADVAYSNSYTPNQYYKRHSYKLWAKLNTDVGIGTLTALPAYQWMSNAEKMNFSGASPSWAPGIGGTSQSSLEVRLASQESSIDWLVGLYLYELEQDPTYALASMMDPNGTNTIVIDPDDVPDTETKTSGSKGLFSQATIPLTDEFRAIAGVRKSWDEAWGYYQNTDSEHSAEWDNFDWKVGFEYDIRNDSMFYFTVATGYRPGSISPAPDFDHEIIESEELLSFEIGSKNEFLNTRLRLNASIYYYDYENYQVPNLELNPDYPVGSFWFLDLINLPNVTNKGGEIEAQYLFGRSDSLSASLAYLDSEIEDPLVVMPFGVQVQGEPLPNSPKWSFNATYQHDFTLSRNIFMSPQITVRYVDDAYVALPPWPLSNQRSYWQGDAALMFSSGAGNWSVNFYGRNLTEEVVKSKTIETVLMLKSPRTYGMTVNMKF